MSTRIALEIAAELDLEDGVVCREAAAVIRAQHAEIERLTAAVEQDDMAEVGRALMEAIDAHAPEGWSPADCPSEIVGDLRNARDEALAMVAALKKDAAGSREYSQGVRDGLSMAASEMDDWACEIDIVSPEHASELREHAASLRAKP